MMMLDNDELKQKCVNNAMNLIFRKFDVNKNADELYKLLSEIKKNNHLNVN